MTIRKYILNEFRKENNVDLSGDKQALFRIHEASQKALKELETSEKTDINLPFIFADDNGPIHLSLTISKDWNNKQDFDTNEPVFHKHKFNKKESNKNRFIYLTLAILIVVFSAILIFFLL